MIQVTPLGVSVGTGLALETFLPGAPLDAGRIPPTPVKPLDFYQGMSINVRTLVRNAVQSVKAEELARLSSSELLDFCRGEMSVIRGLLPSIPITFYYSAYQPLESSEAKQRVREITTPKQKQVQKLTNKALIGILTHERDITKVSWLLPTTKSHVLMMTHLVADLFNYKRVSTLTLLESNTGVTKSSSAFASKFYNVSPDIMKNIPFTLKTWLLLGDKTTIKPAPIKVRQQFFQAAVDKRWNSGTPDTRISTDLNTTAYELAQYYFHNLPKL